MTLRALCLSLLLTTLAIPISVRAEDHQFHILWSTVSPDAKYAIAWATSAPEAAPDPEDEPNPVSNWLIEIATSKKMADLPGLHFCWSTHEALDHYFLDTVWSDEAINISPLRGSTRLLTRGTERAQLVLSLLNVNS